MNDTQIAIHNTQAIEIALRIIDVGQQTGGGFPATMVLLESVALGVLLAMARGNEDRALSELERGIRSRLETLRRRAATGSE